MSAGTAARAARTSPLPARRRVAVQTSRVPVSRCAWGTARPRHPVSGSRSPGTQAGHPARASPSAESPGPCGAARVRMRHARSLLTAHCSLLTAHCSLPVARCPLPVAHAARATSVAGAAASCASLPTRGGMRAISAAVAVLASRGTGPRATGPPRRSRSLPEQARACSRIARGTDASPPLRCAGLPRARTQAPSTSSPRTSARPFPGTRPSPRPSALDLSEGARPRQDAAFRPDEGRERSPTSAARASAEGRPRAPRAHGRVDGRPRAGGPGDPLGPGPRPVAGDLGRLGGRQRREAGRLRPGVSQVDGARPVPEVPAPAPLGPVGRRALVPRHAVSAQDRTRALARRLADAGQVARRPVRLAQPPGPPGDALAGRASPARASRARPSASRLSFLPGRESAGPGGLGEATGPAGVSPRAGIRAGANPRGRSRTRRGTAAGGRPPARPSPRSRFPRTCESPARRPRAPARISSWLTGGRRSRGMHDR